MRDLKNPLAISTFDGAKPPITSKRARRQADRRHAQASRQFNRRRRQQQRSIDRKRTKPKFGEARGTSTKTEEKGPVYVSKKQQAKSCSGSAKGGGYTECGRD